MANAITGLRILVSMGLLFSQVFSPIFYGLYLIAGLSDMADGIIARKTNSVSEFGSRFDSIADFVFVAVCLILCHAEEICCVTYDNEQSDGCAAFHSSVDIINSPAYIHGNPDMFSGDICGCSGRTFHKDRKGD